MPKWSNHDIEVLTEHYPKGGSRACNAHMEVRRSPQAIGMMARKMGLRKNEKYRRQEMTPQLLKELRLAYSSSEKGPLKRLAHKYNVEAGWLKYQARKHGFVSPVGRHHWHEDADAILHDCEGLGPTQTQRRLKRAGYHYSLSAVVARIHSLGISTQRDDGFSLNEVADLLGYDHGVVRRWADNGALTTRSRDNASGEPYRYRWVTYHALKRFLVEYQAEWDMRRVQPAFQPVILDILTAKVA